MEVKYRSFLVIPLKYDALQKIPYSREPVSSMDLNENIKAMLNNDGQAAIGACYKVGKLFEKKCFVKPEEEAFEFEIDSSYLYVFHTKVAFLALGLKFEKMDALQAIRNPGYNENTSLFTTCDNEPFSLEKLIEDFCAPLGIRKFFDGDGSVLLDSFTFTLGMTPKYYKTLEMLRKYTFNLHQMVDITSKVEDDSEDDVRYVYAVKNQSKKAYRWGSCISSQTQSFIVADETMDIDAEMAVQAKDSLPIVMLALYEKYTCIRFTELISHMNRKQVKEIKNLMLRFRAYGTISPANLSRWHNVKQIYAHMLEVNDVYEAVEDIQNKINIITENQKEQEQERNDKVVNIITVFGIVSILASVLSIVQILSDGDPVIWLSTILTTVVLTIVMILTMRLHR